MRAFPNDVRKKPERVWYPDKSGRSGMKVYLERNSLRLLRMKKILVLMVMVSSVVVAQNRDNIWLLGYQPFVNDNKERTKIFFILNKRS